MYAEPAHLMYWNIAAIQAQNDLYGRGTGTFDVLKFKDPGWMFKNRNAEPAHLMYWNLMYHLPFLIHDIAEPAHLMYWNVNTPHWKHWYKASGTGTFDVLKWGILIFQFSPVTWRNRHIWCIEIKMFEILFDSLLLRNRHIWCIEISDRAPSCSPCSRGTGTFDVLKFSSPSLTIRDKRAEPAHLMYWNASFLETTSISAHAEPAHLMYWNG